MPDYPSIEAKVQTAVAYAFLQFGEASGFTYYKGNDPGEMSLPAVVIHCPSFQKLAPDAEQAGRANFACTVNVIVMTGAADTTATVHGNIYGLMQAYGIRSADQIPGLMNAAGLDNFACLGWAIEAGGETVFDDQTRVSTLTFSAICFAA